jgi:hypothetical protein
MKLNSKNCGVTLLLVTIVILVIFISITSSQKKKEGFTARIREIYRPYLRNIRLFKDERYNQIKNYFFSFIRKIGLN